MVKPQSSRAVRAHKQRCADGVVKRYRQSYPHQAFAPTKSRSSRRQPDSSHTQRHAAEQQQPATDDIQITINNDEVLPLPKKKRWNHKIRNINNLINANEKRAQAAHQEEKRKFADQYFWRFEEMRHREREVNQLRRDSERRQEYCRRKEEESERREERSRRKEEEIERREERSRRKEEESERREEQSRRELRKVVSPGGDQGSGEEGEEQRGRGGGGGEEARACGTSAELAESSSEGTPAGD